MVYTTAYDKHRNPKEISDFITGKHSDFKYQADGLLLERIDSDLEVNPNTTEVSTSDPVTTKFQFDDRNHCSFKAFDKHDLIIHSGEYTFRNNGIVERVLVSDQDIILLDDYDPKLIKWIHHDYSTKKETLICSSQGMIAIPVFRDLRPSPFFVPFVGPIFAKNISYFDNKSNSYHHINISFENDRIKGMWILKTSSYDEKLLSLAYYEFIYE